MLRHFPTTSARVLSTITLTCLTGARFLTIGPPDQGWEAWLTFLGALAAADALHFIGKRATHQAGEEAPSP